MRLSFKKGYILAMAMYFMIIAAIMSVGIYAYAYYISKETTLDEINRIKGYNAAMGALRYTWILMGDPVANFGFITPEANGEIAIKHVLADYPVLAADLGLQPPHDVTIKVTEWLVDGQYEVKATYN